MDVSIHGVPEKTVRLFCKDCFTCLREQLSTSTLQTCTYRQRILHSLFLRMRGRGYEKLTGIYFWQLIFKNQLPNNGKHKNQLYVNGKQKVIKLAIKKFRYLAIL